MTHFLRDAVLLIYSKLKSLRFFSNSPNVLDTPQLEGYSTTQHRYKKERNRCKVEEEPASFHYFLI